MFIEIAYIDLDAQTGSVAWPGLAPFLIYEKSFPCNVVAPGNVGCTGSQVRQDGFLRISA